VLTRTLRLEAGNRPAERKEWAMSTHAIRSKGRSPTAVVGIFLALALTLSVLAIQGHSIWSTATHPVFHPASVQVDPNPYKDDLRLGDLRRYGTSGGSHHRISMRQIEARKSG
jgi:hypothetical protein